MNQNKPHSEKNVAVQTGRIKLDCFKRTLGILQRPVPLDFNQGKVSNEDDVRHGATSVSGAVLFAIEVNKAGNVDKR